MRQLSLRNESEIIKPVTQPVFLLDLGLMPPVLISSRGPTPIGPVVYQEGLFQVERITWGAEGQNSASFRISSAFRDEALNEGLIDKSVQIGLVFGDAPYDPGDYIGLFDGVVDTPIIERMYIELACSQRGTFGRRVPSLEYDHENIQPAGTKISIHNHEITIERGDFE